MSSRIMALVFSSCFLHALCAFATADEGTVRREDDADDMRRNVRQDTSASGYIYRMDGENPPVFIKLGNGKNEHFDALMESFKRDHGFRVPSSSVMADDGPLQSPYNIPVLGQEKTVRYGGGYRSTYGGAVKEDYFGGGDSDGRGRGVAGLLSDNFGNVGNFGAAAAADDDNDGFEFGPSPFKYHYDVSLNAADGDEGNGFDDQNYYGSPYTHNEYKSPGNNYHSKTGSGGGGLKKAGHYFTHGSSADGGYKNRHEFDKNHSGKYGKDELKGHYKKTGGLAAGHSDAADYYGSHHSGGHGSKGHKFGEFESHKKGHKTTGFHNVYHKDEYNKQQMFYDDAHKYGKYDKYGGNHKEYANKDGGHRHGGHRVSGYDETHKTGAGQFTKGGYHDGHRGHSDESGHKSHHDHKTDYDALSDNKKYGEHESSVGGGGGDDFY